MSEVVRKTGEITVEVPFGKRIEASHREPGMPMSESGFLAIDNQGAVPTVTYYVVETPGRTGWGLTDLVAIDKAFEDWRNGVTNTPQAQNVHTLFTPRWTREFETSTRSVTVETKDVNGVHPLVIKAQAAIPQPI